MEAWREGGSVRDVVVVGREEIEVAFKGDEVLFLNRMECADFEDSACDALSVSGGLSVEYATTHEQ